MSSICLPSRISGEALTTIVNTVAFKEYIKRAAGKTFTPKQQQQIYNTLLDRISEVFYSGGIEPIISDIVADPADKQNQERKIMLLDSLRSVESSIRSMAVVDPSAEDIDMYTFPTMVTGAVLNQYLNDKAALRATVPNQNKPTIDPALGKDQAPDSTITEVPSVTSLIKDLLGDANFKHMDPMIEHLDHVVASSWVDGKVVNGEAGGFISLAKATDRVEQKLKNSIYTYFADRANGKFTSSMDGIETKFLFFTPDRTPIDFNRYDSEGDVVIGEHKYMSEMFAADGTPHVVKTIIAPTLAEAVEFIRTKQGQEVAEIVKGRPELSITPDEASTFSLSNTESIDETTLPIFYATVLTQGNNLEVFLKSEYPTLASSYRSKHKTSYSEPGSTSGPDQDSAATKLHKRTTPRLVYDPIEDELVMDELSPYLTEQDFDLVNETLSNSGMDLETISKNILDAAKTETNTYKQSILYSIYYRFFNEGDYDVRGVRNPETGKIVQGPTKFRSYRGIFEKQSIKNLTVAQFDKLKESGGSIESSNASLDSSMSSIISSIRSIVHNEHMAMKQGRQAKTNIANHGIGVDAFNTDFQYRTTTSTPAGTFTKASMFRNGKVLVQSMNSKKGFAKITIAGKNVVSYDIKINESGDEGFKDGIPITILNRTVNRPGTFYKEEVADVFKELGFPSTVVNHRHLSALSDAIKANLNNDNNKGLNEAAGVDLTLDNFYVNLLFTSLLNGDRTSSNAAITNIYTLRSTAWPAPKKSGIPYSPMDIMYGYTKSIADTILRTEGEFGSKFIRGFAGERLATETLVSQIRTTKRLIEEITPDSVNADSVYATGEYKIGPQNFTKQGIQIGDESKGVQEMTEKENLTYLLEAAFLPEAFYSKGHNSVLIQPGTQADRLHPQLVPVRSTATQGGIFLMEKDYFGAAPGWNATAWSVDKEKLRGQFGITDLALDNVVSREQLALLLNDPKIIVPYQYLKDNTSLTQYGRILEDPNGKTFVPEQKPNTLLGLDTHALARKALNVHQRYYLNTDKIGTKNWNNVLNKLRPEGHRGLPFAFARLADVAKYLKTHPILYDTIRAESLMLGNSMIVKGSNKEAVVPSDVLQAISVFENDTLGLMFIETQKKQFFKQAQDAGYTKISQASTRMVAKIMGIRGDLDASVATDILMNTYFYNHQILGVSLLNIHSGGVAQYEAKSNQPLLDPLASFSNGRIQPDFVKMLANDIIVPGSEGTRLEDISVDRLLEIRKKSREPGALNKFEATIDKLAYMKAILVNKDSFGSDYAVAKALVFNDMMDAQNAKFVTQVKRNAVYGTGMLMPRLVGQNEPGPYLGKASKTMTVEDDKQRARVLGASGDFKIDPTDGVTVLHELATIKINNSIGNDESSFKYDGVALKSLTVEVSRSGATKSQKRAEFGALSNDLMNKGNSDVDQIMFKMNTAIPFSSPTMLVEPTWDVDWKVPESWSPVTLASWLQHGLSHEVFKYINDDNQEIIVSARKILADIKADPIALDKFVADLNAKKYFTAKHERSFENMQELWEYYGAFTDPNSWKKVAKVIGYHSGIDTKEVTLSDATYPNRDAYIEKYGYTSQEKTGSTNIITWENFLDPDYAFSYKDETGKTNHRWSNVTNDSYGLMLQAQHGFDTTVSQDALESDSSVETHDSVVSLITQIVSAANAEGVNLTESSNISDALYATSLAGMDYIHSKITKIVIKNNPTLAPKKKEIREQFDKQSTDPTRKYEAEIEQASLEYARDLVAKSLMADEKDAGLAGELLAIRNFAQLTLDQKQLLPLVQSQLFAEANKKTVKIKLSGGQMVVSPSHRFLPTYTLRLGTQVVKSGLTREDMNKYFYGTEYHSLEPGGLIKNSIDETFPLKPITDGNKVKLSDIVVGPKGQEQSLYSLRKLYRVDYKAQKAVDDPTNSISFNRYVNNRLVSEGWNYRFGDVDERVEDRLKYAQYVRYDRQTGEEINAMATDEFRSFSYIDTIRTQFEDGTSAEESILAKDLPDGLIRAYYFGQKNITTEMLTPVEELEFQQFKATADPAELLDSVYNYIGHKAVADPHYERIFKAHLYNMMDNDDLGWVSAPTEVYMPHMAAKVYFLNTGEDGEKADTMCDLIGMNEMPSTLKLESMGIITKTEALEFASDFGKAAAEFKKTVNGKPVGKFFKLPPAHQELYKQYESGMFAMNNHLRSVFKTRVSKAYGLTSKQGVKFDAMSNIFVFKGTDFERLILQAKNKRNSAVIGSTEHVSLSRLVQNLFDAKERVESGENINPVDIIKKEREEFIDTKVRKLVMGFPKTLEFIMARIPAQGKQSFSRGKIKNLVFSSKNSIYGPLELILIAGLDYDIDKQNLMYWGLDDDGSVIDWKPYLIDGTLSHKSLQPMIDRDAKIIQGQFAEARNSLDVLLRSLEAKRPATITQKDKEQLEDKIRKVERDIRIQEKKLETAIELSEDSNRITFNKAAQNFITHSLLQVISDPKNAIESMTPISMDKPQSAITVPNIEKLFTDKIGVEDIFISRSVTSNVNPYSIIQYEKVNMDGKSGIEIYASDLKAYLSAYYATRVANAEEQKHVVLKSDLNSLVGDHHSLGVDRNVLQFFKWKNTTAALPWNLSSQYEAGEIVRVGTKSYQSQQAVPFNTPIDNIEFWKPALDVTNMPLIANAKKWSTEGQAISKRAKDALRDLKAVDPRNVDEQVRIVTTYMNDVKQFNSMNVDGQAWEDLSQLLSAATDNAKELILGRIGANNTTNSLISTMIRMGISLRDAVALINTPEIKAIVEQLKKDADLTLSAEKKADAASRGIVERDEFAGRLLPLLKAKLPQLPNTQNPTSVAEYLANPYRQMYTYARCAQEFSLLARILGINKGLKNSAYEVYSYTAGLNDAVNDLIKEHNDLIKDVDQKIKLTFDMKDFVFNASQGNMDYVNNVLDAMNTIRTGINVPYVMLKNKHYFGYFTAMYNTESLRDTISYINSETASVIDYARETFGRRRVTEPMYKKISDTIYEFGIIRFLESEMKIAPLTVAGKTYDLSKPVKTKDVLGRYEFLKDLPEIIMTYEGNEFLDGLKGSRAYKDPVTGESIPLMRIPDLNRIKSDKFAKLKAGLESLKRTDTDNIYDALFLYSLITSKGSYGGGSFMGLFPLAKYMKFSTYLKDNITDIKTITQNQHKLITILNPLLLPQVTTIAAQTEAYIPEDGEELFYDVDEGFDYEEVGGNRSWSLMNLDKKKFVIDHLNEDKKTKAYLKDEEFVRSSNNGMTYQWNNRLDIWVPFVRIAPELSLPYTISKNGGISLDESSGHKQGWEINMSSGEPVKNKQGKVGFALNSGRVIAYISNTMKTAAREHEGVGLSAKMYELLTSDERALDPKTDMYIIEDSFGNYSVDTAKNLEDVNPSMTFDGGRIVPGSKSFDDIELNPDRTQQFFVKGSDYFTKRIGDPAQYQEVHLSVYNMVTEASHTIYNKDTMDTITKEALKKTQELSYDQNMVDRQYDNYVNELIDNLLSVTLDSDLKTATETRLDSVSRGFRDATIVSNLRDNVTYYLGKNPSIIDKINTLRKGKTGFTDAYKALRTDKGKPIKSEARTVVFPTENVPGALIQLITKEVQNNITQLTVGEFRDLIKLLGIDDSVFTQYVKNTILTKESGIGGLKMMSGEVYLTTPDKIKASKQLTSLNDKVVKNKPLYLPPSLKYEYKRAASVEVFRSIAKFLNGRLPGVQWVMLTSAEIKEKYGDEYMNDKGLFKTDGKVIINTDVATIETPLHEFGHVYLQYLSKENPEKYKEIMKESAKHDLYSHMKGIYPKMSKIDLSEEVFCELLSMAATDKLALDTNRQTLKIVTGMSNLNGKFGEVTDVLGQWISEMGIASKSELNMSDTLSSIINRLSDEVLFGKKSILRDFSGKTKDSIARARSNSTVSIKEARDILLERGYIETFCL